MSPIDGSGMSDSSTVVDARAGQRGHVQAARDARIIATPIQVIRVQAAQNEADADEGEMRCECAKYVLAEADEAVVIPPDERHTLTECVVPGA